MRAAACIRGYEDIEVLCHLCKALIGGRVSLKAIDCPAGEQVTDSVEGLEEDDTIANADSKRHSDPIKDSRRSQPV